MIRFLRRERKEEQLFRELVSTSPSREDVVKTLKKYIDDELYLEYVNSVIKLIESKKKEELEKCIKEYNQCGGAALLTCSFALLKMHWKDLESEVEKIATILRPVDKLVVQGAGAVAKIVKEVKRYNKYKKMLSKVFKLFDKNC